VRGWRVEEARTGSEKKKQKKGERKIAWREKRQKK
jgi:hypothetical protein